MPVNYSTPTPDQLLPIAGVRLGVAEAEIRKKNRRDLTLIALDPGCTVAGVFTQNRFCAAPVQLCREHLAGGKEIRALVINTGIANAGTGEPGRQAAQATCEAVAALFGVGADQVLPFSTGVILENLPVDRIKAGLPAARVDLQCDHWHAAAHAIMTTDTIAKAASRTVAVNGKKVTISGISKGAGMIRPNMATMLGFLATDAGIAQPLLEALVKEAADASFNCITIDGDTSTNDTVIVMSNGQSNVPTIKRNTPEAELFRCALHKVMLELAKMIVCDGERVTKFVEIRVRNARTLGDARKVAETVAKSLLVKCSFHGCDPNWGRIIHAVGYSGAKIREELIDIYFGGLLACKGGLATKTPVTEMEKVVKEPKFTVTIDLNSGTSGYTVYTSDLSEEYVDFNSAEYSAAIHAKRQKGLA